MNLKDFYLKKLGSRGKITLWLVNGSKIRRDLEKEFTNFGQHFRFPFIPEYEFWIDKEAVPNERRFFIDHLLAEWNLMKRGIPYNEAAEIANTKERSERIKVEDLRKVLDSQGHPEAAKFHCQLLQQTKSGLSIWLVDGRLARSVFDVEFTEGGHDLIYNFVPKNEVWIDNDVLAEERPYILLHELFERSLMGKGFAYPEAHRKASKEEWQARHNQKILQEKLSDLE